VNFNNNPYSTRKYIIVGIIVVVAIIYIFNCLICRFSIRNIESMPIVMPFTIEHYIHLAAVFMIVMVKC